ncbi:hypothetical protein FB451DRAFT_1401533 [Mycena latifolia]|nr:hypothetical protein FB451DRAFT_1401533 [Mycena latifolia]
MEPPYFVIYAMSTFPGELGPPPVEKLTASGFNVVSKAFLLSEGTPAAYSQAEQWHKMTALQRAEVKHGETNDIGVNPNDTATAMANWVKEYGVYAIDVDYEDYEAMWVGESEQWVIDFTTQLYNELAGEYLITHARKIFLTSFTYHPGSGRRTLFVYSQLSRAGSLRRAIERSTRQWKKWYTGYFISCSSLCAVGLIGFNIQYVQRYLLQSVGEIRKYLTQSSVFGIYEDAQIPHEKIVLGPRRRRTPMRGI